MMGIKAGLIALMLLAVGAPAWADSFENVDNTRLAELIARGVPLIDIRTPGEWKQTGVVEGSHLVMAFDEHGRLSPDFVPSLSQIAGPGDEVALICRTGNRTRTIANAMASQLGYKKIYNVTNGITRWIADGKAVAPVR